jgi:hypothetical protein
MRRTIRSMVPIRPRRSLTRVALVFAPGGVHDAPDSAIMIVHQTWDSRRRRVCGPEAVDYVAIGELECARRLGAVQGAPRTTSFQRAGFECAKQCTADAAKPGVRRDIIESNVPRVGTEPTALIESSSGRVTAKRIKCLQRPTPGEAQTGEYQRRQAPDGRSQTRSLGRSIGLMPVAVVLR